MSEESLYDATARAAGMVPTPSDPLHWLAEAVNGHAGWAMGRFGAMHVETDVQIMVDPTGPAGRPYRVKLRGDDDPWYLADADIAVRLVQSHAEPRYTLDRAEELVVRRWCVRAGHDYQVEHDNGGEQPELLRCQRCAQSWPLADPADEAAVDAAAAAETAVGELVDAIRLTVEYLGVTTLPALPGWSWYDALCRYAPTVAQAFARQYRRLTVPPAAVAPQPVTVPAQPVATQPVPPQPMAPPPVPAQPEPAGVVTTAGGPAWALPAEAGPVEAVDGYPPARVAPSGAQPTPG